MQEADLRFLYDQALENLVRLKGFSVTASQTDDTEFGEDLEHMQELLAKRDLLTFSATTRNFAEATKTVALMKEKTAIMSELYLSSGVPFHRNKRAGAPPNFVTINLYQMVSRILHARNVKIMSDPCAFLVLMSTSRKHYVSLVSEYGKSLEKQIEPMIFLSTKDEPRNFVLVSRILEMAIAYFNGAITQLEKDKIFIARAFRDLA